MIYVFELIARRRQIGQMLELIRFLRREIRCSGMAIPNLLGSYPSDLPILSEMDCSEPFDLVSSYDNAKKNSRGEMLLKEEEWSATDELFYSLGLGDVEEQQTRLTVCEKTFLQVEKEAKEAIKRNGKPAVVLGCSVGAVLVMMLL